MRTISYSNLTLVAKPDFKTGFETDSNPDFTKINYPVWNPDFRSKPVRNPVSDSKPVWNPDYESL